MAKKKGKESNCQFDSRPLKVKNRPNFLMFKWSTTYFWKALDEGYKLALDFIAIKGLQTKLWAPKVARVPIVGIPGLPLGSPSTKCHLDVAPMERCKEYHKGEGGDFRQVRAMVSFVNPSCLWFVPTPKVLRLCTN
jgi:hypothetical protein